MCFDVQGDEMGRCKTCGGKMVIMQENTMPLPPRYTPMCEVCREIVLPNYSSKEEAIQAWNKDWEKMYDHIEI